MVNSVGIAGSGAWGTALAACLATTGAQVGVWGRNPVQVDALETERTHPSLPGFKAGEQISFTADPNALTTADLLVIALPAQTLRHFASMLSQAGPGPGHILLAAKGVETGSLKTMPELASELWPRAAVSILSGPTFATEVAAGLPGAAVVASADLEEAEQLSVLFSNSSLRVYASDDRTGVALGGAIKNVMAIAAGAVAGAGLGSNARAAIISRGLAEMTRLAVRLGARPETLAGLSGLGDLVLSCTDTKSRNYSLGFALGSGQPPSGHLTEGAHTVAPLLALAEQHGVDMPISAAVDAVLNHGMPLDEAVARLMRRPGGTE